MVDPEAGYKSSPGSIEIGGRATPRLGAALPRIGGANHPSAGGASALVLQQEGRWSSDAHKTYTRRHGKATGWVSTMLAKTQVECSWLPSQMTRLEGRYADGRVQLVK